MTSHPTGTGRTDRTAGPDRSAHGSGHAPGHQSGPVRLPVYEGLVRELGDVLAETREVAERTEHQMRQFFPIRPHGRPAPVPAPR